MSSASSTDLTADELALLERSALNRGGDGSLVTLTVTGCAYSCCGRGWQRKDGYEQVYRGWIDNLELPEGNAAGTLMLYAAGLGTLSYVVAVRFFEIAAVES